MLRGGAVPLSLTAAIERWPLKAPFTISSATYDSADCIVVTLKDGAHQGRGEAAGVEYWGESPETMLAAVMAARPAIEAGIDRVSLAHVLPRGGARNAVDCARWALEARRRGVRVAHLAGLPNAAYRTATTISLGTADAMAAAARAAAEFATLKLKISSDDPVGRVGAVRAARPDATLIVDVNGGWSLAALREHSRALHKLGVAMIEQPLPPGADLGIVRGDSPIPLCADESCGDRTDLAGLPEGYALICVKLDKTGGLTEAIALARAAKAAGLGVMVSNMIGTSLAMAPAALLASLCDRIDLDGPLWLAADRAPATVFEGDRVQPFATEVWA